MSCEIDKRPFIAAEPELEGLKDRGARAGVDTDRIFDENRQQTVSKKRET